MTIQSNSMHKLTAALLLGLCGASQAASFSYQGYLEEFGAPAEGRYDVRLTPYADNRSVLQLAAPVLLEGVAVAGGRFAAALPPDALPAHIDQAWLQVEVRATGDDDWSLLPERQSLSPTGAACPASWELAGNSGTDASLDFIGTTDDEPLSLRARNGRGLLIEPSPNFWNGLPLTINFIAGSHGNNVTSGVRGATISGGGVAPGGDDPNISNANPNVVTDHYGVIGGGFNNRAGNAGGTATDAAHSVVGGGLGNVASGQRSTIAGGENNQATSIRAAVAGGVLNVAAGWQSAIPGGSMNCAGGSNSFAAGISAKVRPASDPGSGACSGLGSYPGGTGDDGSFVWSGSGGAVSSGPNQFIVQTSGAYFGSGTGSISIPAGRLIHTSTGAFLSSGGTWTNSSSRVLKQDFQAVDPAEALRRLLKLPVTRWSYRQSPEEGTHMGPMAEDFHRQFGLGADGAHISTVDASGVAIAAIQGLNHKLEHENARLMAQLMQLDARHRGELAALREEFERLRERTAPTIASGER